MQWLHCGGLKIQFSVGATAGRSYGMFRKYRPAERIFFPSGWTLRVYILSPIPFNTLFLLIIENVISQLHDQAVNCAVEPQHY